MTHPSHVNKVISYLFNDNTPQQTTSSSSTTTNTNSDTQGLVASVTSVVPNSHGVLPGVAGSIPGGVGSIPGGVGSGVGSTGGGNKLSISSLSDTDSGCYVMDEYAWVPPGLNPKQVCEKEHDFYEVRGQVRWVNRNFPGFQQSSCKISILTGNKMILELPVGILNDGNSKIYSSFKLC